MLSTWNLIKKFSSFQEIGIVNYEPDTKLQEEKRKILNVETIPFYLNKLEEIAKENNGHLALKRTTWADVFLVGVIDYMNFMAKQDLLANFSNLNKVHENTTNIKNIKKWIETRPKTDA